MIIGLGTDLCGIERIAGMMARTEGRFEARVFTEAERAYCQARGEPAQHFAARFAAKEAVLKALGAPEGLSWHELEVFHTPEGRPALRLRGAAKEAAERLGVQRLHLTLTHSEGMAVATVIAES
ncbi:holo-ACP synthase [Pyxidicoccus fallax]|uniref:Holo-[acyl-carrier-protein] synthase n=1 Tax=Pyxidicoccus fallax TaxID=394095 RepID=A0A346D7B5_9BACT|nr:holo-ACP synthase [Pyxidicoccus fallax]AXM42930.1 holo-acyl-carrier-protein synthase [Pyxidicoccus fallax]NMO18041.1 holo-ACP synthase [Pyxidicoccus fallax]NPC78609.1 holo-ACP synthase [Pyxidicoccus fallax]